MRKDKLDALAHEIAESYSKSLIETCAVIVRRRKKRWFDCKDVYKPSSIFVRQAVWYLEARGLLIRHRRERNLVRWQE